MPSFVTDSQKAAYSAQIDNLHETFGRNITIINQIANENIINIDDPNYNAFGDTQSSNVTHTSVNTTVLARVKYLDKAEQQEVLQFGGLREKGGVSTPIKQDYGIIRIKVAIQLQRFGKYINQNNR